MPTRVPTTSVVPCEGTAREGSGATRDGGARSNGESSNGCEPAAGTVRWIADVDPRRAMELLTDPRVAVCVPLRAALRVLEDSPACGVGEPAEYLRAMMASFGAGGRNVCRGGLDFDAKDLHTKYALALLNAARDPVACAHRDHATELHNFLSATGLAVRRRGRGEGDRPGGLTESREGHLRGLVPSVRTDGSERFGSEGRYTWVRVPPGAAPPAARRPRRGDRLILDVITHESVGRRKPRRARRRANPAGIGAGPIG